MNVKRHSADKLSCKHIEKGKIFGVICFRIYSEKLGEADKKRKVKVVAVSGFVVKLLNGIVQEGENIRVGGFFFNGSADDFCDEKDYSGFEGMRMNGVERRRKINFFDSLDACAVVMIHSHFGKRKRLEDIRFEPAFRGFANVHHV